MVDARAYASFSAKGWQRRKRGRCQRGLSVRSRTFRFEPKGKEIAIDEMNEVGGEITAM